MLTLRFGPPQPAVRPGVAFGGLFVLCGMGLTLVASVFDRDPPVHPGLDAILGAALGLVAFVLLYRRLRTPPSVAPIVLDDEGGVQLPLHASSAQAVRVELAAITALQLNRTVLLVGTRQRNFIYPIHRLAEPDAAARFVEEARARIALLPEGDAQLARLAWRAELSRDVARAGRRATQALAAILVAGFLLELLTGALTDDLGLIRLGANAGALVREGQLYRLWSASFLHGSWLHLYLNGIALLSLGGVIEGLLGTWSFLLLYLASALGGAAASAALGRGPFSVGASTAIFGLLGALAVLNWRFRRELPPGLGQSRRWWIFTLGVNTLISVFVPLVDLGAHAGGFFTGALVAWLLVRRMGTVRVTKRPPWPVLASAVSLLVLCALALVAAAVHALDPRADHAAEATRAIVRWRGASAIQLKDTAWEIAIRAGSTPAQLALAHEAAARAVKLAPGESAFADTLATVEHRLGHDAEAIARELGALTGDGRPHPIYWSQLARFVAAHQAALHAEATTEPPPIVLGEVRAPRLDPLYGSVLRLLLDAPVEDALTLHALVKDADGHPVGWLLLGVPAGASGEVRFNPDSTSGSGWRPGHVRIEPALVETRSAVGTSQRLAYHALDPNVLAMP